GQISTVISYTAIQNLPVNGRQISNLFGITPGVESGTAPRTNGMKVGSTAITLDGITEVDRFGGGFVRVQPGFDTIQEFRYDTTGSDARFASPGDVILQTRSGTNQIHGTAYEFLTDSSGGLEVRQIQDGPGVALPPLVRNEFGGNIGGPVVIPHIYNGRDKTFFFFDYEGLRNNQIAAPESNFVPTMAMWNGDLSNAVSTLGPITIYDPTTTGPAPNYTRTPYPGNIIPASQIDSFAKAVQKYTALPTNNTNPYLGPNFIQNYPNDTSQENIMAKVDQNISDKSHLSVRLNRTWSKQAQRGGFYANVPASEESSGVGSSDHESNIYNVGVDYTQSISNRWLNEIQAGVLRSYTHYGTLADFTNWDATLGLPNPFSVGGWPSFGSAEVCGTAVGGCIYWCACNVHVQALTTEMAQDNATFVHGNHTIQFGGNVSREQSNIEENQQAQGSDYFSPSWTSQWIAANQAPDPLSGSGFAELLLGLPNYLSNQFNHGMFYFRQTNLGLYVQDRYHASQRLTLNYGLRWDYWSPYKEQGNLIDEPNPNNVLTANQVLTVGNVPASSIGGVPPAVLGSWEAVGLTTATANSVGYPSALFRQIYHNFSPRVGAAFKLNNKTVLRGAFGTYYFPMPLNLLLQSTRVNPPFNLRFVNNPFAQNADLTFPYVADPLATNYIPATTVNVTGVCPGCIGPPPYESTMWEGQNWENGMEETWNATLERELPANITMRVSYIGTHGRDLEQPFAIDAAEPQYNYAVRTGLVPPSNTALLQQNPFWGVSSYAINNTGYSWDNSAQLQFTRRFANGLSFDWFYTYSRALSTVDPSGGSLPATSINNAANSSYGSGSAGGGTVVPASYQILGEPNLSYSQLEKLAYTNSTTIPSHRVTFDVVFRLPAGRGRRFGRNMSRPLDAAIGGWEVSTISTWNSGYWMNISPSLYQFGNPRISGGQRPTLTFGGQQYRLWFKGSFDPTQATNVSGGSLSSLIPDNIADRTVRPAGPNCRGAYVGQLAVNLPSGACYSAPVNYYNYSPRANIIGPGAWDSDISLFKTFSLGERVKFRLEGDFFNAFNHPDGEPPNPTTGLQPLFEQPNASRSIQLAGRLTW
ncbi:MAG: TonB-dependent receptor domain-containing protein, partial [Terriglobia bacterium]